MTHLKEAVEGNDMFEVITTADVEPNDLVWDVTWAMAVRDQKLKARLCARDFANTRRDDLFSPGSTRLTERLIDFKAVKSGYTTFSLDVKAAYNSLKEPEQVVVKPPVEWFAGEQVDKSIRWRMKGLLPGRRIAANIWADHVAQVLQNCGFDRDAAFPHLFRRAADDVCVEIHMDDLHGCGPDAAVEALVKLLGTKLELKRATTAKQGSGQSYEHLKRTRVMLPGGVWLQAAGNMSRRSWNS